MSWLQKLFGGDQKNRGIPDVRIVDGVYFLRCSDLPPAVTLICAMQVLCSIERTPTQIAWHPSGDLIIHVSTSSEGGRRVECWITAIDNADYDVACADLDVSQFKYIAVKAYGDFDAPSFFSALRQQQNTARSQHISGAMDYLQKAFPLLAQDHEQSICPEPSTGDDDGFDQYLDWITSRPAGDPVWKQTGDLPKIGQQIELSAYFGSFDSEDTKQLMKHISDHADELVQAILEMLKHRQEESAQPILRTDLEFKSAIFYRAHPPEFTFFITVPARGIETSSMMEYADKTALIVDFSNLKCIASTGF